MCVFLAMLKIHAHEMLLAFGGMLPRPKVCYLNIIYTKNKEYNVMKVASVIYVYLQVFASV